MGVSELSLLTGPEGAAWSLALAFAALLIGVRFREARRRASLNRAVHELRRPLQALALSSAASRVPGAEAIRGAVAALGDLDRAINGGPRRFAPRPVVCRTLVQAAVERWRGPALASDRSLVLRWRAGSATVMADPERLARALDNLIHNAILHGGRRVRVEASSFAAGVRISVVDSGTPGSGSAARGDPRHGHGLRVVSTIAAEHGGRFLLRTSPAGTRATLELPLTPFSPSAANGLAVTGERPGRRVAPPKPAPGGAGGRGIAGPGW